MAAPEVKSALGTVVVGDDDDAWLYGDEDGGKGEKKSAAPSGPPDVVEVVGTKMPTKVVVKKEDREEGEMSGEEGEGESQEKDDDDDSDDDDDDDNVQVTIGDIKAWSVNETTPRNLFKSGTTYQKPTTGSATKPAGTAKGLDIEAQGTINSVPVYEFDLEALGNEEKPWRKPGADITDYFNYGFNEETWMSYCEKQKRLVTMNGGSVPKQLTGGFIMGNSNAPPPKDKEMIGSHRTIPVKIMQQQPGRIDVIGSGNNSQLPPHSDPMPIPVAGAPQMSRKFMPVPGMPPTSLPPPHTHIPMDYSVPPPGLMHHPGMGVPPPGFPPPMPDPFDPFYSVPPPDRSLPPPQFDDRPPYGFPPGHPGHPGHPYPGPPPPDMPRSTPQPWDAGVLSEEDSRDRDWDRERREMARRERERSPHRRDEDSPREVKYREVLDRERERDRDRERDRERDTRKRERERRRSRSPDRDREPSTSRRDREEDKYRSRRAESRRQKDDSDNESRSSTSKHKKSRRRKDDDDTGGDTPTKAE